MPKEKFKNLFEYYGFTKKDEKEYPVVSSILKQLTPERIKKEIEAIRAVKLPPELEKWVKEYENVGERDRFLWRWLYKVNKCWFYSPINMKYKESLVMTKTIYNMFVVLLDDVAEKENKEVLLECLLEIPFKKFYRCRVSTNRLQAEEKIYFKFTRKVWNFIEKEVQKYPNYNFLEEIFMYDTRQLLNAVNYSSLVLKNPCFINSKEYWLYIPHSMQILIDLDLDLMCVKDLNSTDTGKARMAGLYLQEMGRIGNWLTTWEREVKEDDLTSLVVAKCIEKYHLSLKDLKVNNRRSLIKKIKEASLEKDLLKEWETRYRILELLKRTTLLIKGEEILERAKYLLYMHLLSRGLK